MPSTTTAWHYWRTSKGWRSDDIEKLIGAGQKLTDTYAAFNAVPYGTMVWQFWRPLESFYKDEAFAGRDRSGEPRHASVGNGTAG